jgi:hypothetical protein
VQFRIGQPEIVGFDELRGAGLEQTQVFGHGCPEGHGVIHVPAKSSADPRCCEDPERLPRSQLGHGLVNSGLFLEATQDLVDTPFVSVRVALVQRTVLRAGLGALLVEGMQLQCLVGIDIAILPLEFIVDVGLRHGSVSVRLHMEC